MKELSEAEQEAWVQAQFAANPMDLRDYPVQVPVIVWLEEWEMPWEDQMRIVNERITAHNNVPSAPMKFIRRLTKEEKAAAAISLQKSKQRERAGAYTLSDSGAIEKIVDEVLAKSAAQIADFKSGKEKALMSIVGMVMKASAGKANPAQVTSLLKKKLK